MLACPGLSTPLIWVFRAFPRQLSHLLCAFPHGSTSSDGSTDTGCGDAGRSDILCWICRKEAKPIYQQSGLHIYPPPPSVTPVMSELCELLGLKSYQGCDLCKSLAPLAPAPPFTAGRGLPTFHREHFHRLKKTLSKQPRLFFDVGRGRKRKKTC